MKRTIRTLSACGAFMVTTLAVVAQGTTCPAVVETALARANDVCADVNRNQACYGNTRVESTVYDSQAAQIFEAPGDRADVLNLASLSTAPLDSQSGDWGVAILSLQANLPDTLPGQNVTFILFGDVTLTNEVRPEDVPLSSPVILGQAARAANLRSGPGTRDSVVGGLAAGESLQIVGRNAAGDWLRIIDDAGDAAWVFGDLIVPEGDVSTLPVVDLDAPFDPDEDAMFNRPMQAFRFSTGVGRPACVEAPADGMLIQAPDRTTVQFMINGVRVTVGSTGLLNLDDQNRLRVSAFDGSLALTAQGESQIAPPGFEIVAEPDSPPSQPQPYNFETVRAAPVDLLPEPVEIPDTLDAVGLFPCSLSGGVTVLEGEPLLLRFGWAEADLVTLSDFAERVSQSVTFAGEPVPFVSRTGPDHRETEEGVDFVYNWYWVVPRPERGVFDAVVTFSPAFEGISSVTCRVTVS